MICGPFRYKKSPLAIGIAALFVTSTTQAVSWSQGDWDVNFDSNFTFGTSIRVEKRDFGLIGHSSHPQFDWSGYNPNSNIRYRPTQIWEQADGGYSANIDNGNLNFDDGKAFSTQFSGLHELDIRYKDYGLFVRGFYFYDFELKDGSRPWSNVITGNEVDPCADPQASDELCADIRFLDAFVYADVYWGDVPVSIRIGDQVVSWGESTFIQHGINTTNPVDVSRARAPGAELKEVFIPVGMVFASFGFTDSLSMSLYYQYEWERSRLPVVGSYFSTNDFVGEGGQRNGVQLGFTGNPDMDLDFVLARLNELGNDLRAGQDPSRVSANYLAYPTRMTTRGYSDAAHKDADDQGQYGIKFTWFAEQLHATEFSAYHINYHSQRPLISGLTSDFTAAGIAADMNYLAKNQLTRDNITNLRAFSEAQFFYPEDIKLYGLSFNTNIGETALAGEFAYRKDEPLQIDDVELLYMAMPEQLANSDLPQVVRPDLAGISQLNNIDRVAGPNESAEGFVVSDTWQAQFTISHLFGPTLGTDNLVLLGEVGYVNIMDFPDPSVVRLNSPGTGRTGGLEPIVVNGVLNSREGLHKALSDGPETNPFATKDAWGYRLLANADFNNVFAGMNLQARATFAHDVDGITPDPIFLFIEDRKSASLTFTLDYQNKWSASASYNVFWNGVGTTNALSDRDFVSFNIKYSI